MKALLVQLSDIHVRSGRDPILSHVEEIVAAVRNLDHCLDGAIILVSGDLAFAGSEAQYEAVWDFLLAIKRQLSAALRHDKKAEIPVGLFAIPGNHDCDLSSAQEVRDLVIDRILEEPQRTARAEFVETCTSVQDPFFTALDVYGTEGLGSALSSFDHRLAYGYRVPIGDKTIQLLCFNTAWLSRRHERQGSLYLPADVVPEVVESDLGVAMLHHPYNWLEANAARAFRKRLEAVADLILTGHEHDPTVRAQQISTCASQTYVEGGALQDAANDPPSAFNAFVLDLDARRQKAIRFA